MNTWSMLAVVSAAAIIPSALLAAQGWETGRTRGLLTVSASSSGGSLVVVCDPDRVYNPDVSYANIVVTMPKDRTSGQVVFLSTSGQQAAFDVRDGVATQQKARSEDWGALIAMIRAGGSFAVVTAHDTFSLDMEAMPGIACD